MSIYGWYIEAPGPHWLGVRKLGVDEFFWAKNQDAAIAFLTKEAADGVMMAVKRMAPELFAFAVPLGDAVIVDYRVEPERS